MDTDSDEYTKPSLIELLQNNSEQMKVYNKIVEKFHDKMKYLELKNQLLKHGQQFDQKNNKIKVFLLTNITPQRWVTPESVRSSQILQSQAKHSHRDFKQLSKTHSNLVNISDRNKNLTIDEILNLKVKGLQNQEQQNNDRYMLYEDWKKDQKYQISKDRRDNLSLEYDNKSSWIKITNSVLGKSDNPLRLNFE